MGPGPKWDLALGPNGPWAQTGRGPKQAPGPNGPWGPNRPLAEMGRWSKWALGLNGPGPKWARDKMALDANLRGESHGENLSGGENRHGHMTISSVYHGFPEHVQGTISLTVTRNIAHFLRVPAGRCRCKRRGGIGSSLSLRWVLAQALVGFVAW